MCYVELEPCDVWSETEVAARKEHRCSCCRGPIKPGERYVRHFSVFEGKPETQKMCKPCFDDRAAFAKEHGGTVGLPSFFPTMLKDCIGEDGEAELWQPMIDRIEKRRNYGTLA